MKTFWRFLARLRGSLAEDLRPLTAPIAETLREKEPRGVGWPHVFGAALLALFTIQVVTGVLLALYYAPSVDAAHASVRYIDREVTFGGWIRGLHYWAASGIIVVLVLHMSQVFLFGAYKKPRRLLWWVGLAIFAVVLGSGYTGYLLPWDARAYFGTVVGTGIPGTLPIVGDAVRVLLRGGEEVGQLTLTRFYALHVALFPLAMVALVALHVALVRRLGVTAPWARVGEEAAVPRIESFAPYQAARDGTAALVAFGAVALLAGAYGAELGDGPTDPSSTGYVPRPEWYFLGLQHLLRLFPGNWQFVGSAVIPATAALFLVLVPVLDRSPERRISRRRAIVAVYLGLVAGTVWLTWAGYRRVESEETSAMRDRAGPDLAAAAIVSNSGDGSETPAADSTVRGKSLYAALSCGKCHPDSGEPREFAPALGLEGSRVRRDWLAAYLLAPTRIYYTETGEFPEARMPDFHLSEAEAGALADYLATRRDEKAAPPGRWRVEDATPDRVAAGREIFFAQRTLCASCHRIGERGERFGPELTHAGSRLQGDFVIAIIENPYRINPASLMKKMPLAPEEIRAVAAFVMSNR